MLSKFSVRATLLGLAGVCLVGAAAYAAAADYTFRPVTPEVKTGAGSEIAVRLIHAGTEKLIAGAVVFRTRLDMSPENMAEHTGAVQALPPTEPGIYRFKAELSMPGKWALHIQAKVPGEPETVEGTVVFKAKD